MIAPGRGNPHEENRHTAGKTHICHCFLQIVSGKAGDRAGQDLISIHGRHIAREDLAALRLQFRQLRVNKPSSDMPFAF